jgi:SAM-dependent methyltransferase
MCPAPATEAPAEPPLDWGAYHLNDFDASAFQANGVVADVGCGTGRYLEDLRTNGNRALGIDLDESSLQECRRLGLLVAFGCAEHLPVRTSCLDGVLCKVVIPYTDEDRALAEIARVLKPGAVGHLFYHGAGYYLRYLLVARTWRHRFYGLRTLVNTWLFAVSGRRLPAFLGDTLYQSHRRLAQYYGRKGLRLRHNAEARRFCGLPVFIYHVVEKVAHW